MGGSSNTHKKYRQDADVLISSLERLKGLVWAGIRQQIADEFDVSWKQIYVTGRTLAITRSVTEPVVVRRLGISSEAVDFYLAAGFQQRLCINHQAIPMDSKVLNRTIHLCFRDSACDIRTTISGTRVDIIKYYAQNGPELNVGQGENDRMERLVRIEFLPFKGEDPIIVYDMELTDE